MTFLIDGYNVMHAGGRGHDPSGGERTRFIASVSAYAQALGHEAVIIFDGGSSPHPHTVTIEGVTVIESGYQLSADDLLRKKLLHYPPETLIVASSDRAITDDAAAHGVVSIDADAFYQRLMEVISQPKNKGALRPNGSTATPIIREGDAYSRAELDELMERACARVQPKKVDLDEVEPHQKKGHKKSKAERRLERVIKKL